MQRYGNLINAYLFTPRLTQPLSVGPGILTLALSAPWLQADLGEKGPDSPLPFSSRSEVGGLPGRAA